MNLKYSFTKKRFGQHWLINEKILDVIKKTADLNKNDLVLEIGPGRGALTSKLLDSDIKKLCAIELDKDLIEFLERKFSHDEKFLLFQGDILSINLNSINYKFTKLVANIPYNITGPILDIFVGRLGKLNKYNFKKIVFLMQKDVADRIIAKEGSSNSGALSIRIKLLSKVEKICDIPPSSFNPEPKVYSSLIAFQPFTPDLRIDINIEMAIDKLLKVAFNARRKKIKNTLNSLLSSDQMESINESYKISFDLRPQDISLDQWIKMATFYTTIRN